MRKYILFLFSFSALAACYVVHPEARPADVHAATSIPSATASIYTFPIPDVPAPTPIMVEHEDLIRRQDPAAAANQAKAVVVDPNPAPLSSAPPAARVGGISVTVQWLETLIGKPPSTTWVPTTITVTFADVPSQAPLPGKGQIGMGDLTGIPGETKTVAAGALPTRGAKLMRRVVVAAGVGLAGMII